MSEFAVVLEVEGKGEDLLFGFRSRKEWKHDVAIEVAWVFKIIGFLFL